MSSILKKAVPILSIEELEKLHTGSLLGRLQRLRELEESAIDGDWLPEELSQAEGTIIFKDTDVWRNAYTDIKHVLETREHVTRGSKEQRQRQAFEQKHR